MRRSKTQYEFDNCSIDIFDRHGRSWKRLENILYTFVLKSNNDQSCLEVITEMDLFHDDCYVTWAQLKLACDLKLF